MQGSVWQKVLKIASSVAALAVFTLLAYAELFYFVSGSFFEINRLLYGYSVLSVALIALLSGLTLYFGVSLFFALYHKEVKRCGVLTFVSELVVLAVGALLPVMFYYARTVESAVFTTTLPYFLAGLAAALFLLLIPLAKRKWYLAFVAVAVVAVAVAPCSTLPSRTMPRWPSPCTSASPVRRRDSRVTPWRTWRS